MLAVLFCVAGGGSGMLGPDAGQVTESRPGVEGVGARLWSGDGDGMKAQNGMAAKSEGKDCGRWKHAHGPVYTL